MRLVFFLAQFTVYSCIIRTTSEEFLLLLSSNSPSLLYFTPCVLCCVVCCATGDEKQVSKEAMAQQAAEAHSAEIRSLGDDIGASFTQSVSPSASHKSLYIMLNCS